MSKKMLIDATHAEETRVVVVDGNKVDEFDFESLNKRQLAGNIYLAKVTRVEPSLQAAFVDYGGNRHGFLAFSEIHPDYYQIPVADREALLKEEAELNAAAREEEEEQDKPKSRSRRRRKSKSAAEKKGASAEKDAVVTAEVEEPDTGLVEDLPEHATAGDADAAPSEAEETDAAAEDTAEAKQDATATEGDDGDAAEEPAEPAYESVGAEDVKEEIAPRKPRARRYKIQEVIKVRQILLVQVVKEERGNKGAALTTYLSLAGRYCVLMPNTARGGGISRKITNAADRKKLKQIAGEITVPEGAGLIIRTAGAKRTKTEIKRDYEYLLRQWEQIRDLTLKSIAPAHIYEEGSLIKRSIRDLYSRDIDEIFVEGERGYREAKDYMKMLMPSHAKNVKLYSDAMPLFSRYQVENYLSAMFNPTVQLKSGGYIVIDVTEALVAIDVNSGRATKEGSIEETALKTNLEAAAEVARQARLRDLAGLIVIDFIDMEERKNNASVEKRLKDSLKTDRARIQVGRISGFGLLEMSRQRLRPGMLEATTAPCPHCHGTGRTRSDDSLALAIMRELEEEGVRQRAKEVLVTAPVAIANYMLNAKREHVTQIEERFGLSIRIEGDPSVISPDYRIDRLTTASRALPQSTAIGAGRAEAMPDLEDVEDDAVAAPEERSDGDQPKKRRRRRRRRGKDRQEAQADEVTATEETSEDEDAAGTEAPEAEAEAEEKPEPKKSRSRSRRRSKGKAKDATEDAEAATAAEEEDSQPVEAAAPEAEEAPAEDADRPAPAADPEPEPAPAARTGAAGQAQGTQAKGARDGQGGHGDRRCRRAGGAVGGRGRRCPQAPRLVGPRHRRLIESDTEGARAQARGSEPGPAPIEGAGPGGPDGRSSNSVSGCVFCVCFEHSVEGDKHFAHDGDEGDLVRFAGRDEAFVSVAEGALGVEDGAGRGHEEGVAGRLASALAGPPAEPGAAFSGEGGEPRQGGDLGRGGGAELRQFGQQHRHACRPDPGHGAHQAGLVAELPPVPDKRRDVGLEARDLGAQRGDMGVDGGAHGALGRAVAAFALIGADRHQHPPAGHQSPEIAPDFTRRRGRLRGRGGGEARDDAGIDAIRLGVLGQRPGKGPHPARLDQRQRQACRPEHRHQPRLAPARGLQNHKRRPFALQPLGQVRLSGGIIGKPRHRAALRRQNAKIEPARRNIAPGETSVYHGSVLTCPRSARRDNAVRPTNSSDWAHTQSRQGRQLATTSTGLVFDALLPAQNLSHSKRTSIFANWKGGCQPCRA